MTRVDFYILEDPQPQAGAMFACRLTEKAFKRGHQVYINTGSDQQLRQLDDLLWTFRAGSFLPHTVYGNTTDKPAPIQLGHATEPDAANDVLINLAADVPTYFSRFSRVAELVAGDESLRTQARERFRFYKERGYPLHTHNL